MNHEKVDEFHGIGGAYVVENGVRRRVEEPTKDHPEGNAPRDRKGNLIAFPEPKKAPPTAEAATPSSTKPAIQKGGVK